MLFTPEMMMPSGPPPQAVLDQRLLWQVLLFLLGSTFVLRLIGLDVAGALLSGLMLVLGVMMTRDGMQEMAKYALVYSVLCGLNFFFDILPLLTELGGRVSRSTEPIAAMSDGHGLQQTTYTLTTKTTPFFDYEQGLIYNMQSLSMVLSPLCMAMGVYLAITAHNEIQRNAPPLFDDDFEDVGLRPGPGRQFDRPGGPPPRPSAGGSSSGTASAAQPRNSRQTLGSSGRDTFERFQGQGHKLGQN